MTNIFLKSGVATTTVAIENEIEKTKNTIIELDRLIFSIEEKQKVRITNNTTTRFESIQIELKKARERLSFLNEEAYQLDLDIIDSKYFIKTMEARIIELSNSIITKKALGEIRLQNCPQCLGALVLDESDSSCFLCKQHIADTEERTHAKRLKQELELQLKETSNLVEKKEKQLLLIRGEIPGWKEKSILLQRELDSALSKMQSTRDDRIDELLLQKGAANQQIETLSQHLKGISLIESLKKELSEIQARIINLELEIKTAEINQLNKKLVASKKIEENTLKILRRDLDRQEEFKQASSVDIDYYGDTMSLDGSFNFSASSNTYLKNSIRFSIFFTSLLLDFMRYPKFILCDNMEDKGMEKERSQNFQTLIVKLSNRFMEIQQHQIIFTTSMIAEELNQEMYCIGPYYDETSKTLNI